MTAREAMSHELVVELLPWLVNDSLDELEKEAVLEHDFPKRRRKRNCRRVGKSC